MEGNEWLQKLRPGDLVIITGLVESLSQVDRITETLIILKNGSAYRMEDGFGLGGGCWHNTCLKQATPEAVANIRQMDAERKEG